MNEQKKRPKMDYEWTGKTTSKKSDQKNNKNRKSISKCRIWTKRPQAGNRNLVTTQPEWTRKGLKKPFRKNPIQKIEKTVKIKVNLSHVNKKQLARKRNFVRTPFSVDFQIRAKKCHAAKPLAFSLHFLFRRDQTHYSNLNSKIVKMNIS